MDGLHQYARSFASDLECTNAGMVQIHGSMTQLSSEANESLLDLDGRLTEVESFSDRALLDIPSLIASSKLDN